MSYAVKLSTVGDGEQILSGGQEGSAFLWSTSYLETRGSARNTNTRESHSQESVVEELIGHTGLVGAVDNNRTGFATCGDDGLVRYWQRPETGAS